MKKFLTMTAIALMATVVTTGLTACDSDDEDGGGSGGPLPKPSLVDADGNRLQVKSVTQSGTTYSFGYDEDGRLTSINGNEFEGNTFKIETNHGTITASLNGSGLISKFTRVSEYDDKTGTEKESLTMTISYSGKQITGGSVKASYSYKSKTSDREESANGTGTAKLTWSNGNLTKANITSNYSGVDDGEKFTENNKYNYVISYGDTENTCLQMPYLLAKELLDISDYGGIFAALGLLGNGPKFLPSGYVVEEYEDGEVDSSTKTLAFTQYTNGALKSEKKNNSSTVTYQYNILDTRAVIEQQLQEALPELENIGMRFFKKHRK